MRSCARRPRWHSDEYRPEGTAAILALRDFLKEHERQPREQAEAVIALYHLAPDGKQLAERWLQKPVKSWDGRVSPFELEGRAIVLGAMGRTSFECDWLARHYLEGLDWNLAHSAPWRTGLTSISNRGSTPSAVSASPADWPSRD